MPVGMPCSSVPVVVPWGGLAHHGDLGVTAGPQEAPAVGCKESTRAKVVASLHRAIESDFLSPAEAASLRGGCMWVLCRGRAGKAALQPLARRQHERGSGRGSKHSWQVSSDPWLAAGLRFLLAFFESSLPDVVYTLTTPVRSRPPVVVLSGASWHPVAGSLFGAGRLAFIVWFSPEGDLGERLRFACTEVADPTTSGWHD